MVSSDIHFVSVVSLLQVISMDSQVQRQVHTLEHGKRSKGSKGFGSFWKSLRFSMLCINCRMKPKMKDDPLLQRPSALIKHKKNLQGIGKNKIHHRQSRHLVIRLSSLNLPRSSSPSILKSKSAVNHRKTKPTGKGSNQKGSLPPKKKTASVYVNSEKIKTQMNTNDTF